MALVPSGIVTVAASLTDSAESLSVLYVLPISLLAMSFGFRAGLGAGLGATAVMVMWALRSGDGPDLLASFGRAVPLLLLGALVGVASDRLRDAERIERHAVAVAVLQREAAEVHDDLVQRLAVTKWVLESGDHQRGLEMLEENVVSAQQLVSRMLGSGSVLPGDLRRSHDVSGRDHSPTVHR